MSIEPTVARSRRHATGLFPAAAPGLQCPQASAPPAQREDWPEMAENQPTALKNARTARGELVDVVVERGRIARLGPGAAAAANDAAVMDLEGRLVLPGLIDGHLHLDKTFLGLDWRPHRAGPNVIDRIEYEVAQQSSIEATVIDRASRLAEQAVTKGTVALRTHVDIDPDKGLRHLHDVLQVTETYRDAVDIQVVAFPQSGVVRQAGVKDLLDAAVREGADYVGGIDPATLDGDLAGQLNVLFDIAGRRDAGIDIHLHDAGPVGIAEIEAIAERTRATGLSGRVTLSHAHSLGSATPERAARLAETMAEAGISLVTACPGALPLPPLAILREAGVVVFVGSDNVRDSWSPFGNADMLERLMLLAYRSGYRRDEEIEATLAYAGDAAARALGLAGHGLAVGNLADLVAVPEATVTEAIVNRSPRRMVFKRGRLVARDGAFLG